MINSPIYKNPFVDVVLIKKEQVMTHTQKNILQTDALFIIEKIERFYHLPVTYLVISGFRIRKHYYKRKYTDFQ